MTSYVPPPHPPGVPLDYEDWVHPPDGPGCLVIALLDLAWIQSWHDGWLVAGGSAGSWDRFQGVLHSHEGLPW